MWTGRQTLNELNTGLTSVKAELKRVDNELRQLNGALTENGRQQTQMVKRLASIRLDELQSGGLIENLSHADMEVVKTLEQREKKLHELENVLAAHEEEGQKHEQHREKLLHQLEETGQKLIDAERVVQLKLEEDKPYQEQLNVARIADSVAEHAEEKAKKAATDRVEKGKPFEADPLFIYLWKRHFNTSQYSANPLTRFLDGWVAGLCGYQQARATYWTLLEIPKRLEEHAENVRLKAESELEALEVIEKEFAQDLQVTLHQEAIERLEQELANYDERRFESEEQNNRLLKERAAFLAGQDEYSKTCIQRLSAALERADVYELRDSVYQTKTKEDDALSRELEELREDRKELERDLDESRRHHERQLQRLQELEEVRRKFKHHRYDDLRSGFTNEALIASVLNQFLKGIINGNDLWGTMRRHQRHRDVGAWPDFGSGGLGRKSGRRKGGFWHSPGGRSGGFKLPKKGGFSSP